MERDCAFSRVAMLECWALMKLRLRDMGSRACLARIFVIERDRAFELLGAYGFALAVLDDLAAYYCCEPWHGESDNTWNRR